MAFTIKYELDPIYETIILLYQGYDLEKLKSRVVSDITDAGGNGEEFYQKHCKELDKYLRQFKKYRVGSELDDFFFKDVSMDFYNSFSTLFLSHNELLHSIDRMDNNQVLELIFQKSVDIFDKELPSYSSQAATEFLKTENITSFINDLDLNENEKWKVLLVFQNPQKYYRQFARLIKDNIQAYEKATETIKPSTDKYLQQYKKLFSDSEKAHRCLENYNMLECDIKVIVPSMASSMGIFIMLQTCYYGLLAEKVMDEFGLNGNNKEYLMTCLKALSDNSKFEILTSLKVGPKYATELAAQLSLTSATVSHHMSTLLASRMVYVEKANGKYYYHVDETTIITVLEQLKQLLL